MEGVINPLIADIIQTADGSRVLKREHRLDFAPYIVVQLLRTATSRDVMAELLGKQMQELVYAELRKRFPDVPEEMYPSIEYNRSLLSVAQAQRIFDEDHIVELCAILNNHV
jgi:hypothetical protein